MKSASVQPAAARRCRPLKLPRDRSTDLPLSPWSAFRKSRSEAPELYKAFTPLTWLDKNDAPFLIMHGTADETVPVTSFATFYITGYSGNSQQNSQDICPTDAPTGPGEIRGYFIKYVDPLNTGGGGTQPCDPDDLQPCVAVLTK